MSGTIAKKVRFIKEIDTLYPYIMHRLTVKVRNIFKMAPLYAYEDHYNYDPGTQDILDGIKKVVPDSLRGDNAAFTTNWKNIFDREKEAKQISQHIRAIIKETPANPLPACLENLQTVGYTRLQNKNFKTSDVDTMVEYLNQHKVYPSHVAHFSLEKPQTKEEVIKNGHTFGSYDIDTILRVPYMAKILSDPDLIGLIAEYFGCLPVISSINLFWAFPDKEGKSKGPQRFHRDVDDYKTVTMFINLTDSAEDDGAHCYIEKSHTHDTLSKIFDDGKNDTLSGDLNPWKRRLRPEDFFSLPLNGYSFDKLYTHFFMDHQVKLFGPRGTVLITDNYGIHRGVPPKSKNRLILWVSFALTSTHTQSADVKPQKRPPYSDLKNIVQDNPTNRYVLRNMIDFTK